LTNNCSNIKYLLNKKVEQYNSIDFIYNDPISIPHQFSKQQDIEIAGFFAALLAWGNRKTIIQSCKELMGLMDNSPYNFIMNLDDDDDDWHWDFENFAHRTFNFIDTIRVIDFLRFHYWFKGEESLETAFSQWIKPTDTDTENALNGFHHYFFDKEFFADEGDDRTKKHIAAPFKKSACKKLNMFLRWMVRKDNCGVDFGIWNKIKPSQLVMPLDVHVLNVAESLNILQSPKANWQTAITLTNYFKQLDAEDPVKYDFALFSIGVEKEI
jgi:uncharacterized protein (TIGR02757 family)